MSRLHAPLDDAEPATCGGTIRRYLRRYRFHPPESRSYERTFQLLWCSDCRTYATQTVHVPRATVLPNPLADLAVEVRETLERKELALVKHLDRMARRGQL
ncbi:hypothetical protein LFM09_39155 [Lentzea alba]|uniref:hypothetical protein n=1 Tax=Lentzea alba TaxID=2714351 RepID=UPI0039BF1A29